MTAPHPCSLCARPEADHDDAACSFGWTPPLPPPSHLLLSRVRSGAQTGVDIAALRAAAALSLPTAGTMPQGFRTLAGPRPEYASRYGCTEHASPEWAPRTRANVEAADATLRLAVDFNSAGERCTANACRALGRPVFDIHLDARSLMPRAAAEVDAAVAGVRALAAALGRPVHLNVAGNSERTAPGIEAAAERVLRLVLLRMATTLRVWTARVSYRGADRLDITRKSAGPAGLPFAPSWAILRPALDARNRAAPLLARAKDPACPMAEAADADQEAWAIEVEAWERYVPAFEAEMRASWQANRAAWDALLLRREVTLCCYCSAWPGSAELHCHRRLCASLLVKCGAVDMGER